MLCNLNEQNRQAWLKATLEEIPAGLRILDAGAGELKNRVYCEHLDYVSQDFCQYEGKVNEAFSECGFQSKKWNTSKIDLVCDITEIPEADASFDVILCSEVLEHVPEPTKALDEFFRLLKPGGKLILTAPFGSLVHMAPYHFCSGFSKYWYEHHLEKRGAEILYLEPNGDWYAVLSQELGRLGGVERKRKSWTWPLAYLLIFIGKSYFLLRPSIKADDLACFGWQCIAMKK